VSPYDANRCVVNASLSVCSFGRRVIDHRVGFSGRHPVRCQTKCTLRLVKNKGELAQSPDARYELLSEPSL